MFRWRSLAPAIIFNIWVNVYLWRTCTKTMEFLLTISYAFVLLVLIWKMKFFRIIGLPRKFIPFVFILKIAAGLAVWIIYTYYYTDRATADIFKYFDDSQIIYDALFVQPADFFQMLFGIGNDTEHFEQYYSQMGNWMREFESDVYNDSHVIIRFNAVARIFSFGYYNVHTVLMCFLSLVGLTAIYKSLVSLLPGKEKLLAILVFFMPSVLFWGSGVLKEGLLFFGIGMVLQLYFNLLNKKATWGIVLLGMSSLFILLYLKFYVLIALMGGIISHFVAGRMSSKRQLWPYLGMLSLFMLAGVFLHYLIPQANIFKILEYKQGDFIRLAEQVDAGSQITIQPITRNLWSFLSASPRALLNVLTRPFPFESLNPLILIASVENLLIFLLIGFAMLFRNKLNAPQKNLVYMLLFISVLVFLLIGWITPVMGAIVRYKVPVLPFFLASLLILINHEKLFDKLPFLKFLR